VVIEKFSHIIDVTFDNNPARVTRIMFDNLSLAQHVVKEGREKIVGELEIPRSAIFQAGPIGFSPSQLKRQCRGLDRYLCGVVETLERNKSTTQLVQIQSRETHLFESSKLRYGSRL
jgi:hypothetical protein